MNSTPAGHAVRALTTATAAIAVLGISAAGHLAPDTRHPFLNTPVTHSAYTVTSTPSYPVNKTPGPCQCSGNGGNGGSGAGANGGNSGDDNSINEHSYNNNSGSRTDRGDGTLRGHGLGPGGLYRNQADPA